MASKRDTIAAAIRFIDQMGAEVALSHQPPLPRSGSDRLRQRMAVDEGAIDWHTERRGSMVDCTCNQEDEHDPILPVWSPYHLDRAGRVAVIGPCPTFDDVRHGEAGWSRGEKLVASVLRRAGVHDDQVTWLHTCWCWPDGGTVGQGRKQQRLTRPPSAGEMASWYPHMMAALDAADVEYVLLHGSQAVHAWRGDMALGVMSGHQFLWRNRWFVSAVGHASGISRDAEPGAEKLWREGIAQFAYRAANGITWDAFARRCLWCGKGFYAWDEDGVGVCREHMKKNFGKAEAAKKKHKERLAEHLQGGLI